MEQSIIAKMKKRFRSKKRQASKEGLGHQAAKAASQQAVTNCSISFLSDWKERMAGGIGDQEIRPVQIWQRPQDLESTALAHPGHCTVTHCWQSTKRKLFTLEISPGKWEQPSRTQWPTTKATLFLITGLFHGVINLFRKLLGSRLLDLSPLVPAERSFTGREPKSSERAQPLRNHGLLRVSEGGRSKPLQCWVLPDLRGAASFGIASSSFSEA